MRTIQEIKKEMTDGILSNGILCEAFGLDRNKSWDAQTSSTSIINILLYVVALAHHSLESIFERFKGEVDERIASAYPGSISWLWNRAMEYQHDEDANAYFLANGNYETTDTEKQIVKHAAVVEEYNTVMIKVSGEGYAPLDEEQKAGFSAYMNALKFAGVKIKVSSLESDNLSLKLKVWRNRLLMPGKNSADIETAIRSYLDNIFYGGKFNKTKLMDAVRTVQGVEDVTIENCVFVAQDGDSTTTVPAGQNYEPLAGHINLEEVEYEWV